MVTRGPTSFIAALAFAAHAGAAEIAKVEVQRPEGARQYLLALPAAKGAGKRPLVILLHGHGGSAEQLLGRGRGAAPMAPWLDIAEREGLILAVPDGLRGGDGRPGWNDCRGDAKDNPPSDDVALIDAIIAREIAEHDADRARIYMMGMSNGAMMTLRYAVERGEKLAAFAAASGAMAAKSTCPEPRHAVPALLISGTADPLVPYKGGAIGFAGRIARGTVIGMEETARKWRELGGLASAKPVVTAIEHRNAVDPTHATRMVWGADPRGMQVELLRVEEGGHAEPSASRQIGVMYSRLVGRQNHDLEATEEAWAFFKDKRRNNPREQ